MSWREPARPGHLMAPRPGAATGDLPPLPYPVPAQTSIRTQLFIAVAIGGVFALFVWVARAPTPRALGAGLVLAAGSFCLLRAMDLFRIEWPTAPNGKAVRLAGIPRWRLNGFDALTDSRPGLSQDLRNRLRALATAILARHDLIPGSPGALDLLGAGTHELLFRPPRVGTDPPPPDPDAAQIAALVDRLIALGESRVRPGSAQPEFSTTPELSPTEGNR